MTDALAKSDKYQLAATALACGKSPGETSALVGVSDATLRRWRLDPEFREKYLLPELEARRMEVVDTWRGALGTALNALLLTLEPHHVVEDPKLASANAKYILDKWRLDSSGELDEQRSGSTPVTLTEDDLEGLLRGKP